MPWRVRFRLYQPRSALKRSSSKYRRSRSRKATCRAPRWVWFGMLSMSPPYQPTRPHRLDFRVPVEHALVPLQVMGARVRAGVRLAYRRHRPELAERIAELGAHAIDGLLEPDGLELLGTEALDHRQQEFDTVVVDGQALFFEEVAELRHVICVDSENAQRFQHAEVLGSLDTIGKLRLAAALETQVVALEAHPAPEELDDLRALALADVHQSHRGHAPTA